MFFSIFIDKKNELQILVLLTMRNNIHIYIEKKTKFVKEKKLN